MPQFLVVIDTPGIKQFVFGTDALAEIRGASALLDRLNRRETQERLNDMLARTTSRRCSPTAAPHNSWWKAQARITSALRSLVSEHIVAKIPAAKCGHSLPSLWFPMNPRGVIVERSITPFLS